MCTRAQCCWFCLGGFLCAITVSGQVDQKHQNRLHIFMGWVICGVVGEHKHVCSKAYDAHDVAAVARFLVLGCCYCCWVLYVVLLVSTHMCVHKGTVLLVLLGRFLLCYYCFWAGRPKTPESLTHFYGVGHMWCCW